MADRSWSPDDILASLGIPLSPASDQLLRQSVGDGAVNRAAQRQPLAFDPLTQGVARTFGYGPAATTPAHARDIATTGVGFTTTGPTSPNRVPPVRTTAPPPAPLAAVPITSIPATSIAEAGVGVGASPIPSPTAPLVPNVRQLLQPTPAVQPSNVATQAAAAAAPAAQAPVRGRGRPRGRRRVRATTATTTHRDADTEARARVHRVPNNQQNAATVARLQNQAANAIRGRQVAYVTETNTITTTYKGANQRPDVQRISTHHTV